MSGRALLWARILLVVAVAMPAPSRADAPMFSDDTWRFSSSSTLAIDGGLAVGFPPALPTGLSRGIAIGMTWGRALAIGARISYASASESSAAWQVTHRDLALRATGSLQHVAGRGLLALRLGIGGTYVHESRLRQQGMRAGLEGDALATSANALLPAANLDAVVGVFVAGPWRLQLSGGPSIVWHDGAHAGWSATVGVAWHP
jgi:hypothetical protein